MQTSQTNPMNMRMGNKHFPVLSATAGALFDTSDLMKRYAAPKSPSDVTPNSTENDVINPGVPDAGEGAIDISDGSSKAGPQDTPPGKP